jgi:hypothetical protein
LAKTQEKGSRVTKKDKGLSAKSSLHPLPLCTIPRQGRRRSRRAKSPTTQAFSGPAVVGKRKRESWGPSLGAHQGGRPTTMAGINRGPSTAAGSNLPLEAALQWSTHDGKQCCGFGSSSWSYWRRCLASVVLPCAESRRERLRAQLGSVAAQGRAARGDCARAAGQGSGGVAGCGRAGGAVK